MKKCLCDIINAIKYYFRKQAEEYIKKVYPNEVLKVLSSLICCDLFPLEFIWGYCTGKYHFENLKINDYIPQNVAAYIRQSERKSF